MNQKKLEKKSRTLVRDSSRDNAEKVKKNPKLEKAPLNSKRGMKDEINYSDTLNTGYAGISRESPRKSRSVERKSLNKNSVSTPSHKSVTRTITTVVTKRSSINAKNPVNRRENSVDKSPASYKTSQANSKSSKLLQKSKTNERKTNAQIAKSFVQSVAPKSTKPPRLKSNIPKASKHRTVTESEETVHLERPRTSTIRKEPAIPIDDFNYEEKEEKLKKRSLSRSKTNLKEDSGDEKASYEDDFEDYNSDFEDSDSESISDTDSSSESSDHSEDLMDSEIENVALSPVRTLPPETHELPLSIQSNTELSVNKNSGEKMFLKMSDRSSLNSENIVHKSSDKKSVKVSRSFINFASAVQKEELEKDGNQFMSNSEIVPFTDSDMLLNLTDALTLNKMNYTTNYLKNMKQMYVQTENFEEEEIQTDEIKMFDQWTQNPLNGTLGHGGDKLVSFGKETNNWKPLFNDHSFKLSSFLQRSSNIILTLLDEEFSQNSESSMLKRRQDFFLSDGYYLLTPLSFLENVPIVSMYSSPSASPYILTIHGNMVKLPSSTNINEEKGIICIWNVFNSKKPEHILMANSQPICGTFGPGGSDLVIAGMVDGAVMLWDLTNFNSNVFIEELGELLPLLSSTYNTATILDSENHSTCIVGINAVYNQTEISWKSSNSMTSNYAKNFHVLTLEDMGVINVWVVVEVLKPDISGLETDLGLAPGGKFRLVKSSSIYLHTLSFLHLEQRMNIRTFDFQLIPNDSSRLLVTTDVGLVLHVTRHSGTVEPRFYSNELELTYEVRCIDCSPHNKDFFLIGCSDGSIKLYSVKIVRPLMEFLCTEKGESVNHLQWSTVYPTVFFVLSSSSYLHLWNLIEDSLHPMQSYHFQDSKITWFVLQTIEKRSNQLVSEKYTNFLVSKENGELEVHTLKQELNMEDYTKQLDFMQNL